MFGEIFGERMRGTGLTYRWVVVAVGVALITIGGCATEPSKPASTMSQDQVRDHADKTFDKLKQEEKNRAVGSGVGPY